jgi:arsenate reductase
METVTMYHNPRCGKSRAALTLLQERNVPLHIVEYLKKPLTRKELGTLRRKLGLPANEWVRRNEPEFGEAGLRANSPEDELLGAMAEHPILMERPIAVCGDRAVVGRPPERVLELLDT